MTVSCSGNCRRLPVAQRASFVTEFLQREVQHFLRLAQPPAATSRFIDLGTDSLMAVELRNRLHSQFGGAFTINATAVFDYPTIGGLAEYLAAQLPDADGEAPSDGRARSRCEAGSADSIVMRTRRRRRVRRVAPACDDGSDADARLSADRTSRRVAANPRRDRRPCSAHRSGWRRRAGPAILGAGDP